MKNNTKHNILIFTNHLLPPSQTFIRTETKNLEKFHPFYVGSRRVKGLELPNNQIVTVNNGGYIGRARELIFKISGYDFGLSRFLSSLNPKLIHAHFGPAGVLALPLVKNLKIPLIVSFHGYDATVKYDNIRWSLKGLKHFKFNQLCLLKKYIHKLPLLKERTSLFIAYSDFMMNKLVELGFPDNKIIRHYHGIDIEYFKADPNIKREQIVLFVGRLVEKKGCEYIIRAMAKLQKKYPEVELVLIGDGPLRSSLETLASNTIKRYRFLGVQTSETVRNWMEKAKIFCVPSITAASGDAEGFGVVFIEANAMGLPVVSSLHGPIPEAVAHGETALLAPEKDYEALAGHIIKLFEDDDLWERFSVNGRKRVCEKFNLQTQTQKLENIYHNVVKDG